MVEKALIAERLSANRREGLTVGGSRLLILSTPVGDRPHSDHQRVASRELSSKLLPMKLMTFHRVLIGSAVAVFLIYGLREVPAAIAGDLPAAGRAALGTLSAAALIAYLRWLSGRKTGLPESDRISGGRET